MTRHLLESSPWALSVASFASYSRDQLSLGESARVRTLVIAIKAAGKRSRSGANSGQQGSKSFQQALWLFGGLGALFLEIKNLRPPIALVPIPSSDCLLCNEKVPRAFWLAQAVARRSKLAVRVFDVLRWRYAVAPSHTGGTRDPVALWHGLSVTGPAIGTVVLVDDVVTTGGHIIAAARRLASANIQCHQAVCFAKAEAWNGRAFGINEMTLLRSSRAGTQDGQEYNSGHAETRAVRHPGVNF